MVFLNRIHILTASQDTYSICFFWKSRLWSSCRYGRFTYKLADTFFFLRSQWIFGIEGLLVLCEESFKMFP